MAVDGVSTGGDTHTVGPVSAAQAEGAPPGKDAAASGAPAAQAVRRLGPITVGRLKWVSFTHSCIYTALLICAFALSKPEPLTFVLGMTHGLLWIGMSLICIVCARLRILSLRLAVAVAVLGGIGPFFGSYEFVREQRRRGAAAGSRAVAEA
jgi:hypothetical protein